jgi:hypothetical protein
VLTGISGSGKTLLTRHIFWRILRPASEAPGEDDEMRRWLFVQIDGRMLGGLATGGSRPDPGTYVLRAIRNALEDSRPESSALSDEQIRAWLDHSPTPHGRATHVGIVVAQMDRFLVWSRFGAIEKLTGSACEKLTTHRGQPGGPATGQATDSQ